MPKLQSIFADIPRDLLDADDALTLYGRWASDRETRQRCGSAERYYRPEGWEAVDRRRDPSQPAMRLDELMLCQRALSAVPDIERMVLAILYVPRPQPREMQLRLLRIPPRLSQERHLRGLRMFDNRRRILQAVEARITIAVHCNTNGVMTI